jgi:LysM repeat protein
MPDSDESESTRDPNLAKSLHTVQGFCGLGIGSNRTRFLVLRIVTWCATAVWRTCVDWRTKRPVLTRVTAHLSVIALALATIFLSGVAAPAFRTALGGPLNAYSASLVGVNPQEAPAEIPSPTPSLLNGSPLLSNTDTIVRQPQPHTAFPERLRAQVISYVVQAGDTVFDIAVRFGLSPETIAWSNRETLMDAPWLIKPGIELYILPVDGVYHTVRAGETTAEIAASYEVGAADLYNEWNELEENQRPHEGQLLVVPGGKGEEVEWEPPPPPPLYAVPGPAQYSYGICGGTEAIGPGANGWFILPTGSYAVSGWYFHDARNPGHIGLDYRCRLGDPIMAADSGVVTIAGWNGGYGIMVEINHGNGFVTRYGHFSELAVGCGHQVYQGDLIGYCGSTGYSSGPHLHFEIRSNGVPQDPMVYQP